LAIIHWGNNSGKRLSYKVKIDFHGAFGLVQVEHGSKLDSGIGESTWDTSNDDVEDECVTTKDGYIRVNN